MKIFWFSILLISIGCSKNESSYFPLSEGYKWQYDVAMTTRDGLENQKYIFKNLGKGELNGAQVYMRESLDGSILYYSNSSEGIH